MPIDPETYLRMLGERLVLDRDRQGYRRPGGGPLGQAAHALLAVGAVPPDAAERIVQDYEWAQRLRDPDQRHLPAHHALRRPMSGQFAQSPVAQSSVQPLAAPRVVVGERTIDQPWGRVTIRTVSMESGNVAIDVVIRWPDAARRRRGRHPGRFGVPGPPSHPRKITVTDDRGGSVQAGFSGGGGEEEWTGRFRTHPSPRGSLAFDTGYLDLLGERIDLPTTTGAAAVRMEPVERGGTAAAALWNGLAGPLARHGFTDPEVSIDAFLACGLLGPDDPVIGQVRAVTAALGHGYSGRQHLPGQPAAAHQATLAALPEPWAALVARQGRPPITGPTGILPIAAATPVFDGMSIAVSALTSEPDAFRISIVMVGNFSPLPVWDPESTQVAWWARDDRGGVYLGQWDGSSADGHRVTGDIGFDAPLDPAATRLDLMPTGPTTRAVIEVPLAWESEPAGGEPSGETDG